jgi:hypothetical protein
MLRLPRSHGGRAGAIRVEVGGTRLDLPCIDGVFLRFSGVPQRGGSEYLLRYWTHRIFFVFFLCAIFVFLVVKSLNHKGHEGKSTKDTKMVFVPSLCHLGGLSGEDYLSSVFNMGILIPLFLANSIALG